MPDEEKKMGMYGETPRVVIGNFTISQQGENTWIEHVDGEGMEAPAGLLEAAIQDFFNKYF